MATELAILETQMQPLAPHFAQVLGKTMPVERLMRTVMISVERLPQLLQCDRQSIFNAAMSAACLGLEVDGVTGQAYLIPFKGRAQLVIGYKGYNTLAARSGITITGNVVRQGDEFDYQLGSAAYVRHKPKGSKGAITHAWACAQSLDRPAVVEVLDIDELLAVKGKSPGAKRSDSPWNDPGIGFPAMCQKTAKRRLARSMPLNVMQQAARLDEAVDEQGAPAWISPDKGVVIDGEFSDAPQINHDQRSADELLSRSPSAVSSAAASNPLPTSDAAADDYTTAAEWDLRLAEAAAIGSEALKAVWAAMPKDAKKECEQALRRRHQPTAAQADARAPEAVNSFGPAQDILTDIWFHFSATDDPTLRGIADRARALMQDPPHDNAAE